jgi:tryptophan 7-halogenase
MVNRILVLGGGSAGFLAAITVKARLPDLEVTVVRSKEIGIIGVGESTTIGVPEHLHNYLGIDLKEFYQKAQPQWKLGIRFLWGKRPWFDYPFANQLDAHYHALPKGTGFYCDEGPFDYVGIFSGLMTLNNVFLRGQDGLPVIPANSVAYHIENKTFVAFLEGYALGLGVIVRDDTVKEVFQDDQGITGLRLASSGETVTADLFLDCSGFASVLLGKTLKEPFISFKPSLYNDRAVIGGWNRQEEPIKPYTTAETMDAGWCWQIEHEHRIERGYVHSSDFISDDAAQTEFRTKNPKVESTRIVKLISGRYERGWVKNVIAIGNASGFVEPLESTSLAAICRQSTAVAETLFDCDRLPRPSLVKQYNKKNGWGWDRIRQFLAVHYKFNTRLDTPYWRECREKADLVGAADIVEYYKENGPSVLWRSILLEKEDQFNMEGYLSMLVGQQVPYRKTYTPDAETLRKWQGIKQSVRDKVTRAFSIGEALKIIRSPYWTWPSGIYYVPLGTLGVNNPSQAVRAAP